VPIHNLFYTGPNNQHDPAALRTVGPVLTVQVEIPTALASQLQKQGATAPTPAAGFALVDTGASSTCETVLTGLGINPVGQIQISTPSGQSARSVYPARFAFPGSLIPPIDFVGIVGVDLRAQAIPNHGPIIALIGRDILQNFILNYNGPGGMYTLAF
jgi:hypothetical protein